jgi:hypothetical protein
LLGYTYLQDFSQPALISFAVGVLVPWNATNRQYTVAISFEDLDRQQPIPVTLQAEFVAGRPPSVTQGQVQRVILAIPTVAITLPGPGTYQAVARLSSGDERRAIFHAEAVAAALSSPPGSQR